MAKPKESFFERIRREKIGFLQLWFTDVLGFLKGITISSSEMERAFRHGLGFDGSSIEGFARVEESDMVIMPEPDTFAILPWKIQEKRAGRVFCSVLFPNGRPVPFDPREVLRKVLKRAEKMGFSVYAGCELECFYFKGSEAPQLLDSGGYFDLTPSAVSEEVREATIAALESFGIVVECGHHEVSPSQHEFDLRYTDALRMADNVITCRFVARQIAREHNVYCSFMPKPVFGINGSGMHIHLSLFKNGKNSFFSASDEMNLSPICRHFVAGLLRYAPEITAVTNQWVNSYKRLVPGYEAPVYVSWARMNRSALVRVPAFSRSRPDAARVEFRSPDPACNPYLALALIVASGLKGVETKMALPPPTTNNIYRMTDEERREANITCLPKDLSEAIGLAEKSELVRTTLGDELFNFFLRNKRQEWEEYKAQVTEFEIKRYLPIL
ncbi:MAG: glutamine synthetase family protein [candidate division WOR-3 bacterium]